MHNFWKENFRRINKKGEILVSSSPQCATYTTKLTFVIKTYIKKDE